MTYAAQQARHRSFEDIGISARVASFSAGAGASIPERQLGVAEAQLAELKRIHTTFLEKRAENLANVAVPVPGQTDLFAPAAATMAAESAAAQQAGQAVVQQALVVQQVQEDVFTRIARGFARLASLEAIGLADGGTVYAADGFKARGTDTVPAMLSPNEFVVNAASAEANKDLIHTINAARGKVSSRDVALMTEHAGVGAGYAGTAPSVAATTAHQSVASDRHLDVLQEIASLLVSLRDSGNMSGIEAILTTIARRFGFA
jgi:hypothetical protein